MAVWELFRAMRRHLAIVCVGAVLTLGALGMIHRSAGLYQGQVGVVLIPPSSYYVKNPFWGRDYSLIAIGGVMRDMANRNASVAPTASTAVTLAGRGERDGYIVNLPNIGGQWVANYDRPILDVQSVGPTQERAQQNLQAALTAIRVALQDIQDQSGVPADRQVTATLTPSAPVMAFSRGRPSRSMLAALVLGVGITMTTIVGYDRRTAHRERRPVTRLVRRPQPA